MLGLRGILLVSCGRLEQALVSFDKYLALEPQDTEAHALGSLGLAKLRDAGLNEATSKRGDPTGF